MYSGRTEPHGTYCELTGVSVHGPRRVVGGRKGHIKRFAYNALLFYSRSEFEDGVDWCQILG